jgi:hypothetical protein
MIEYQSPHLKETKGTGTERERETGQKLPLNTNRAQPWYTK